MKTFYGPTSVRLANGAGWVYPNADLEFQLRYSESISLSERLAAASILACYKALICATERQRREIIREIRKGAKL